MTTDITELAQSLKAAAKKLKEIGIIHNYSKSVAAQIDFEKYATPDNVIVLVEALEKAQQERENWRTSFDNERFRADKLKAHIDEMTEEQTASINELSRIIQKEVKAKREAEKRIAELESRTVKLPKRSVGEVMHMSGFSRDYAEGWCAGNDNAIHVMRVAGIKVEGE
ncbi:ead/Ea22-like family protein [Klebsiella pneumoniae]|uniref:ead/Ea22-like family protein n=1 Tax=Klebsiella pneumoniae TaxID=573 RepID=UPI0039852D33